MTEESTAQAEPNTPSTEMATSQEVAAQASQPSVSIPDEYRDAKWAGDIKSTDDLWKQHANLQGLLGKRPAGIPSNEAGDEEWGNFYNSLGRPEDASGYEFSDIEGLPEGLDLTPHTEKFAEMAHRHGLSQKQADSLRKEWLAYELDNMSQTEGQFEGAKEEIREKYFDENIDNLTSATDDALNKYLPEDLHAPVAESMKNPYIQAAFAKLYEGMQAEISETKQKYGAEDKLNTGTQSPGRTVKDVRVELQKTKASDAYKDPFHSGHNDAVKAVEGLRGELQRMLK